MMKIYDESSVASVWIMLKLALGLLRAPSLEVLINFCEE